MNLAEAIETLKDLSLPEITAKFKAMNIDLSGKFRAKCNFCPMAQYFNNLTDSTVSVGIPHDYLTYTVTHLFDLATMGRPVDKKEYVLPSNVVSWLLAFDRGLIS